MANTYKWVINSLNAKIQEGDLENVVEIVHYRYQVEDADGDIVDIYGSVGVDAPEADGFIPYESLTQAHVESWLEAKLDVEELKTKLDAKLEAFKNPTHVSLNLVSES